MSAELTPRSEPPRITIITPTRNAAAHVAAAIDSIQRQGYPNVEHLIVDNCSTDGTLECLARYPHLRVVSEPDRDPHDAMNKGVRLASGDVIGFLNADDFYTDGVLAEVGRLFADEPQLDIVVTRTVVFADAPDGLRTILVARDHVRDDGLWLAEHTFGVPGFNGRFFRRRVFERVGDFTDAYEIGADRHFLLRGALSGLTARHVSGRVGLCYCSHSGSRTLNPERRHMLAIGREHVRMAVEFLDSKRLTATQREVFRAWFAFESAKFVLRAADAGRFGEAVAAFSRLVRREPLWPRWLAQGFTLRRAVRRAEREADGLSLPHQRAKPRQSSADTA
jgi:glycosyltransferase involved in cell wall biosynthesis